MVTANGLSIRSLTNQFNVLDLTLGCNILCNESFSIRPGMVIPLTDGDNKQFDYEAMVQMNYFR